MQVTNVSLSSQNPGYNCSFKHVYPVYHWHKVNNKFVPATGKEVRDYQRILAKMLCDGSHMDLEIEGTSFIHGLAHFIAMKDNDYRYSPYVRSYYNNHGGYKYDSKGEAYDFLPCSYLITGCDAVEFENTFGKPIGMLKKQENTSEKEIQRAVKRAKSAFATQGFRFVKSKCRKFIDKTTSKPLELHTVFVRKGKKQRPELVKIAFFPTGEKSNPLIKNNII